MERIGGCAWVNSATWIFSGEGKKGDAFAYIEVFKRLIASGDAMTR